MRQISGTLKIARQLLMSSDAWVLLVEIPTSGGGWFRVARSKRHITAGGRTWQACTIKIEAPGEDAQGSLGQLAFSVPNVSRIPIAYVELDTEPQGTGEILGRLVTCYLTNENALGDLSGAVVWQQRALAADADTRWLRVECGHPAQTQRVPGPVYSRHDFPQLLRVGA